MGDDSKRRTTALNAVALAAAIAELLADAGSRRDLAAKGRARAEQWSWSRAARETLETYRERL